jgi:predicted Rossmann fold nucleotide-binding protein DprA/Smf involved in DNA uptake
VRAGGKRAAIISGGRVHQPSERLAILTPFPPGTRVTRETARQRNRIVLDHASAALFVHAAPGGETETLAREAAERGLPLYTLAGDAGANANLLALGARAIDERAGEWPAELRGLAVPTPLY